MRLGIRNAMGKIPRLAAGADRVGGAVAGAVSMSIFET